MMIESTVWYIVVIYWNSLAHKFEAKGEDVFIQFHVTNTVFFLINIFHAKWMIENYEKKQEIKLNQKMI